MLLTDPTLRSEGNLTELGETKTFTLKANAKAFRLLIDGLYSDKIKAPIRELATNAYDAHLEAGVPETPFEIHLPSLLDLTFQVRDFGLSMSHDQVMNLYTTMFGSTKDQSNEQVGGFGIGSKSPFAYTDTFSVTCYSGTERRDYFAHLGTDGVPALTHLETSPCSEPRGTRVSMPVNQHDRWDFRTRWMTLREGIEAKPSSTWTRTPRPTSDRWPGLTWATYGASTWPAAG